MPYLQQQIASLLRSAVKQSEEAPYHEVLEYIRCVNNSTFLTDFYPTNNTRVEFRALNIDSTSFESYNRWFIGARTAYLNKQFGFYFNLDSPTKLFYSLNNKQDSANYTTTQMYGDHTFMMDSTGLYIDGTKVVTSSATGSFTCDYPLAIGGLNNGGELTTPALCSYTYVKIWESNVLVHDYIPVLNNKMQPCLYDRVTNTFLNAITRDTKQPTYDLGFKRWNKFDVDYIESSGTQYIDTGFKFTNTSAFEITCAEAADFESSTVLCGARNNTDTTSNARIVDYSYSAPSVLRGEYLLLQRGGYDVNENVIYIPYDKDFHTYYQSPTRMSIDDTDRPTVPSLVSPNMNFYIFWQNVGTATAPAKAKIKVKNCKLWDNGTLVRDYKPSVRTYNDGSAVVTKAFLYDEVYNKAYDNAGTGSFKAYIAPDREVYNLSMHDTMDIDGFYLAEDGTKTVSSDGTSCYTEAIQVKEGDIIEWTVTAEAVTANKRIHGYTTNADITTGQKGSWVEMLAKIVFSTTSDTTQTATFVVPSGVNYIRLSHANVREFEDSIVRIRTYEVGKAIKYPANNGFTLDAPNSSNFILDLLTRATTTSSYYMLDTRQQTGSSNEEEFGIGGSSTGSTVNWKCESETILIKTNGTNWARSSNYTYSHLLVGYKDGNTFKRTASFYDFNNQKTSDVEVVTALRDIADNTKPLTILHTTSSNWLQNGADIHYFKYLQDGNDVWYDCIPVRNATVTSSVLLFDRVNNTSLPNTGSGTPTFVALD